MSDALLAELRKANSRKTRAEMSRRRWMDEAANLKTQINVIRLDCKRAIEAARAQTLEQVSKEDLLLEVCRRLGIRRFRPGE